MAVALAPFVSDLVVDIPKPASSLAALWTDCLTGALMMSEAVLEVLKVTSESRFLEEVKKG